MVPAEESPGSERSGPDAPDRALAGVIGLGFDHFREVNAAVGVAVADVLLGDAERRLERLTAELLGDGGRVRRLPGPAFAVLVGRDPPAPLYRLAEQMAAALTDPFDTTGGRIALSCSCGVFGLDEHPAIALTDGHGAAVNAPIDPAVGAAIEAAIDAAKHLRRGGVLRYDPARHGGRGGVLELRAELRDAVTERQLGVAFQPVVSLDHSRVEGVEALARWHHPRLGPIAPSQFLGLIESPALAATLTETMLDAALAQLRRWRDDGVVDDDVYVSVNVPAVELGGPLDHLVQDLLERHRLTGATLMLELRDAGTAALPDSTGPTARRLRDLGVALAVDDFGAAFAGLDRLLAWPVTCLKLDRSLIARVATDTVAQALIAGVGSIATHLDLALVAEGVEAAPQAEILRELAVPSAQGYLWSPPLAAEHATVWLHEYRHLMGRVPPGAPG